MNEEAAIAFSKVVNYLEKNKDKQTTVNELVDMMNKNLEGSKSDSYTNKYMKIKLQEHFNDIVFGNLAGKRNVITFSEKASEILHCEFANMEESKRTDSVDNEFEEEGYQQKLEAIITAANFLKAEIGDIKTDNKIFAEIENLSIKDSLNFLPDSLRLFLQSLIVHKDSDLKIAAIGQPIIQASRPR